MACASLQGGLLQISSWVRGYPKRYLVINIIKYHLRCPVPGDHPSCVPGYPERYLVIHIINKYLGATTLSGELQATDFLGTTWSGSGDTELV